MVSALKNLRVCAVRIISPRSLGEMPANNGQCSMPVAFVVGALHEAPGGSTMPNWVGRADRVTSARLCGHVQCAFGWVSTVFFLPLCSLHGYIPKLTATC